MNVPLPAAFDVAVSKPIDSRLFVENFSDLNNIFNKYVGLTCYVQNENRAYTYNGVAWEKVIFERVDSNNITNNFVLDLSHNGKIVYVNNSNLITCTLPSNLIGWPDGFNTTVVQLNNGGIGFLNNGASFFKNVKDFDLMTGAYSMASILRIPNTSEFLIFGDLMRSEVTDQGGGVGGFNTLDFPVYTLPFNGAGVNRYMSGCWPYPLDLPINQKRWRETLPFNRIFNVGSALATSVDGKYQTAVTINRNINPVTLAYDLTDGYILSSSNSGANWNITNPFSDNFISVAMNSDGQYQTVLTSSCRWGTQDLDLSTLCPNTGLKILNSNDYGNTWSVSNFPQFTGVWSKILMNDLGNMRVVISEKTAHLLLSYNSGVTWSNLAPPQQIAYNNVSMSKDGKYLIALTNKSQAGNFGSRIWISNNSGQTWVNDYPYQPIHFEPYRVRTTGVAATLKTGEALYKYNGIGQVSEIYLHKYNLDGEPTVWNSSIQPYLATANNGLNIYQWVTIRSKSNPNQQYRGRYILPLLPEENAPDTIRIPFQDYTFNDQDPQLVFNNDNSIYYISPQGGFGAFDSYSMDCAAISNDGRVQAIIDPHTTTNFWSTSSVNYDYPGICISHDYGLTWRAIAYRNRGLFIDTGYCTSDVQGYSVPSYDLAIDGSGKNLFLNNFFYSENSGISWTNRKVGKISILGRSWIPSNIRISSDGKVVTMTEQVRFSSSNKIYNIDNFFEKPPIVLTAPNTPTATNVTQASLTANWNNVAGATSYRIDVSTISTFATFIPGYNNLTVNSTSQSIIELTPGITYYVRVRAVNQNGTSSNSPALTQATLSAPTEGYDLYAFAIDGSANGAYMTSRRIVDFPTQWGEVSLPAQAWTICPDPGNCPTFTKMSIISDHPDYNPWIVFSNNYGAMTQGIVFGNGIQAGKFTSIIGSIGQIPFGSATRIGHALAIGTTSLMGSPTQLFSGFGPAGNLAFSQVTQMAGADYVWMARSGEYQIAFASSAYFVTYNTGRNWTLSQLGTSSLPIPMSIYDYDNKISRLTMSWPIAEDITPVKIVTSQTAKYQILRSSNGSGVYRSNDFGFTWNYSQFPGVYGIPNSSLLINDTFLPATPLAISRDGKHVLAINDRTGSFINDIGKRNTLYISNDYGVTWTQKFGSSVGLQDANADYISIDVSEYGRYMFAASRLGRLYFSQNFGDTWSAEESVRNWSAVGFNKYLSTY